MKEFNQVMMSIGKNFLIFAIVLIAGFFIVKFIMVIIKKALLKSKIEHTAKTFLFSIIRVVLYAFVAITALGTIGVNISSLITALGAAAITAGLAIQDTLKNLVSGLIILLSKPFVAGDLLEFGEYEGFVDSIRIFYTTIHTWDNKTVRIPNSVLTSTEVINCSTGENRRITLHFTVSYDDNLTKVKSVIYNVMAKNDLILEDPEPKVYVNKHLDNGVDIVVFAWAHHDDYYSVYFYMQENVKLAFDENGITIPYPHIQIKNDK